MKWLLLSIVVLSTVLADLLQSREMSRAGAESGGPAGLGRVLRLISSRRYLMLAVLSMAISFFAFLALVQTEPLSFAVPASAASFVIETALAKIWLGERVGRRRTAGVLLVFAGILLVAR